MTNPHIGSDFNEFMSKDAAMTAHYGPFDGDGRKVIRPPERFTLGARAPAPMRRGTARLIVDEFCQTGRSYHSSRGSTLWVLLWWCEYHHREYVLRVVDGGSAIFLDKVPAGVSL